MSFAFSFAGDDIEDDATTTATVATPPVAAAASSSAFPVQGKPLLPPTQHGLSQLLAALPSKIAYSLLDVTLEQRQEPVQIPRRELWDVRVQLMAEDEGAGDELEAGLGSHDVKTGIYEGGFKSWESSVDLVKVLADEASSSSLRLDAGLWVIELGCGTALPTLALFQWALAARQGATAPAPLHFTLADYNPSVLHLVTLPNLLLTWALHARASSPVLEEAFTSVDGELELTDPVRAAFMTDLAAANISLSFLSGAWSPAFVEQVYTSRNPATVGAPALVLGAETIYSPFALKAFADTLLDILGREGPNGAAVIAAKRLYFGVGGSLDDFVEKMRELGAVVGMVREETEGVRRGVVKCSLP